MSIVQLYMYDLSEGWCGVLGPLCPVEAVWHTSIVAFNKEYVFGSNGIKFYDPGNPKKVVVLGETKLTPNEFKIYVKSLKYSTWNASSYEIFTHNCNHFTNEISRFLGFGEIPPYVFESVEKLRKSPFYSKIIDWVTKQAQTRVLR